MLNLLPWCSCVPTLLFHLPLLEPSALTHAHAGSPTPPRPEHPPAVSPLQQEEMVAGGEAEPELETLGWGWLIRPRRSSLAARASICYDRPSGRSNLTRDEI